MGELLAQLRAGGRLLGEGTGFCRQTLVLEMAGQEDVPFGETGGALEHVAQLADVAWPGLLHQPRERLGMQSVGRPPRRAAEALDQAAGDRGDVLPAIAQRRQMDVEDVQAIVEVFAKAPLAHLALQIAVGSDDDAGVDRNRLDRADAADLALLQHAQELALKVHAHLGDLIEQQRATVGLLEHPGTAALARPGEGAVDVAEERAVHQRLGQRRAVDGDEGSAMARRVVVDGLRKELLARAALAGQKHRRIAMRRRSAPGNRPGDRRAFADDVLPAVSGAQRTAAACRLGVLRAREGRPLQAPNQLGDRPQAHRPLQGLRAQAPDDLHRPVPHRKGHPQLPGALVLLPARAARARYRASQPAAEHLALRYDAAIAIDAMPVAPLRIRKEHRPAAQASKRRQHGQHALLQRFLRQDYSFQDAVTISDQWMLPLCSGPHTARVG